MSDELILAQSIDNLSSVISVLFDAALVPVFLTAIFLMFVVGLFVGKSLNLLGKLK